MLPRATGFYCAFHRGKNISGRYRSAAADVFHAAVAENTVEELQEVKQKRIRTLPRQARAYIESVPDELQYLVSRIVTGGLMYGTSTCGQSESMHAANETARVNDMDIFNVFGNLIEMEQHRFNGNKEKSQQRAHRLSEYA